MLYRLIVLTGPLKGRHLTVERAPMTLGRDPDCSIVLDDEEVARRHAVVEHVESGLMVRDLGTMNRILVNKRAVREAHLKHGDEVEIGRTRFLVQASIQTEVEKEEVVEARPRRARGVLLVILLLLTVLAYHAWRGAAPAAPAAEEEAAVAAPEPAEPASAGPPGSSEPAVPPELTEELRNMRRTLATLKETVDDLSEIKTTLNQMTPTSRPAAAARPAAGPGALPPDGSGWLTIASVEHSRLPRTEQQEEVRQLKVWLVASAGVAIDPSAIRLEGKVYVRDGKTGRIQPSRAAVSIGRVLPPDGPWTDGRAGHAILQCKVPPGGEPGSFYGYSLRVYYRDVLQEEALRPRSLLDDMEKATARAAAPAPPP